MKVVHYGAGNIGRGFIGQVLSQAGYEVVFVDVSETLVNQLQERGEYTVSYASDTPETFHIRNVTAINGNDHESVIEAIASADLVTTAIGVNILKHIAPVIAQGLERRLQENPQRLHVIACENAIGGSAQLKAHVYSHLSDDVKKLADTYIAFPNAAVDRIVPIQQNEDPLHVVVEPYHEWIVDKSMMFDDFQPVEGILLVDDLEPYIERKLFTVNTGHCVAAYLGYLQGLETIQDVMKNTDLAAQVESVMKETGAVLIAKYGFNSDEHSAYIRKILGRFRNPHLTDEVVRVGRSPIRKISPNDRLIKPAAEAQERGLSANYLAKGVAAALRFDYPEDPEAVELQTSLREKGLTETLTAYTGLQADHPVHQAIVAQYEQLHTASR
ncbi:mannitol-1-phosphate 5-dehydrogenase [Tumebacillus flagellatus]|uniref:Mannitol-1-phosphate 5-dehydrogenase n=1 Tax=Tumebacillus flagellatus TaxID=1157490 RepID=A0A074LPU1_9BACL|nr:mannitol-1-phosphate 5-dehydrogenase [Tumebacillus flagellatus]KEO84126.1 mannitol-1-phosphate 5-dehydrogenase [Tumebacillus flagellatus]